MAGISDVHCTTVHMKDTRNLYVLHENGDDQGEEECLAESTGTGVRGLRDRR